MPGAVFPLAKGDSSKPTIVDHRHRDVQRQVFAAQVGLVRSSVHGDTGVLQAANRGNASLAIAASTSSVRSLGRRVLVQQDTLGPGRPLRT